MSFLEFKVNKYITLKLEDGFTVIYIKGKEFLQCRHLLLIDPQKSKDYSEIKSIDEAQDSLKINYPITLKITPEQEFWGHCSNLQVWDEHNYDTRLLHSNLAFPLLKKLMELGDVRARKMFKEEIANRIEENYPSVNQLLIEEGYINYLSTEELKLSCPKELRVEKLILSSRRLLKIPSLIGELPIVGLKYLNLTNNGFSTFPEFVLRHKSLEVLILKENQLKSLPEDIDTLEMLKKLDVSENQLDSLPTSVRNLSSLETLILSDNKLRMIPNSIGELKNLRKCILSNNMLRILPKSIGNLRNLEELSLRSNDLMDLPSGLNNLKSLISLDLSNNHFKRPSTIKFVHTLSIRTARNYAKSLIDIAENFLKTSSIISFKKRSIILNNINQLKKAMNSDDLEEIESKTYELSMY